MNRTSKYLINPARSTIGKRVTGQLVQVRAPYVVVEMAGDKNVGFGKVEFGWTEQGFRNGARRGEHG